jgi:hypothetical protein
MSHGPQLEISRNFPDPRVTTLLQSWTFEPWIIIPLLLAIRLLDSPRTRSVTTNKVNYEVVKVE